MGDWLKGISGKYLHNAMKEKMKSDEEFFERYKKLEAVAEAAQKHCEVWDRNRESFYNSFDIMPVDALDPEYRGIDYLGLAEALKALTGGQE